MKRVAVIGGGMAGLAAAYYLQTGAAAAGASIEWELFEQGPRLGGKVVTDRIDGYVIEGGPDSFITQKPHGLALCRALGLDAELIPCNQEKQKVYILVDGRLRALPAGYRLTAPTQWKPFLTSSLFSWRAKLRIACEHFLPARPGDDDESVYAFIERRFGTETADKIAGPLMAGIYVADPKQLSLLSTFAMFRQLEQKHGSLIKALRLAARRPSSGMPMFMSMRDGMGQLMDSLSARLKGTCHLNTRVSALEKKDDGFALHFDEGASRTFDAVILAAPPAATAHWLKSMAPNAARILEAQRTVSTATVSLGYTRMDGLRSPMDGFGFVVPAFENRPILACTWSSIKFDGRAPEGHTLLRVFIGGDGREEIVALDDEALIALVRDQLKDILGLTSSPELTKIYRWPNGNPQYDVGHLDRMRVVESEVAQVPGLFLAGSGYRGIGLPDCIKSGQEAANKVLSGA